MIHNEEIRKELEAIAPYLAKQDLRLGFTVPKGYFEELPEMVLESVSPLAELKKPAFKVPANYFESLPDLVLERVAPKPEVEVVPETKQRPQRSWMDELFDSIAALFQPRYALRLAGIAILVISGFFLLQNNFNNNGEVILAEAEQNPLQEYGISLDDLTDDDLALLLTDEASGADDNTLDPAFEELLNNIDLDDLTDEDLEAFM